MKQFSGYKAEKSVEKEILPAGGYIINIIGIKDQEGTDKNGNPWEQLVFAFDVAEGEYRGFFRKQFDAIPDDNEYKKWKGTYRLYVPQEGSDYFKGQKRTFNNAMWAFEASNPGFHFNWNEQELKGKKVGVLFRNYEWEMTTSKGDYLTGWATEPCKLVSVEDIKEGNFKMPKDKPLKKAEQKPASYSAATSAKPAESFGYSNGAVENFEEVSEDDDDLPF